MVGYIPNPDRDPLETDPVTDAWMLETMVFGADKSQYFVSVPESNAPAHMARGALEVPDSDLVFAHRTLARGMRCCYHRITGRWDNSWLAAAPMPQSLPSEIFAPYHYSQDRVLSQYERANGGSIPDTNYSVSLC